jgi:Cof subfamily protein (haloacid dehalogenase superfamily)
VAVRPRLVASDLDGTLLRSDGTLDPRTKRALEHVREAGGDVVICTARPTRWMRPLAQALGVGAISICANGGVVWDLHGESVLASSPLEPEVLREIVALLSSSLPGGSWAVERTTGFAREPGYLTRWPVPDDAVMGAADVLVREPAVKLLLRHDQFLADILLERAREVVGHLAELSHSNSADHLLEISALGVSKASALARLCSERAIDAHEVIAFGDMPNDLPMLRWAGHGVAVANAHPDVLAAADEVTAGNDEAGVAVVLERVFALG